tara:strand:+ start:3023 stop:4042 length:1020 start_codon:yes stop_codon:yes gene_type:complete
MKRAVITGESRGGVVHTVTPEPLENWVLVKIQVAPLCTEYKGFLAGHKADYLGHEASGEVVEIAQPGRVQVGDRVAVMPGFSCGVCDLCRSGDYIHCKTPADFVAFTGSNEGMATLAQYMLKPDWLLVPIPDDMSFEHGAMACCGLGPTYGALERLQVRGGERLLITGLGPVGLGGIICAQHMGAEIIALESNPYRISKAEELGVKNVINLRDDNAMEHILDLTQGNGVDRAIDCSGSPTAHRFCIDALRRKGHLAFVGESSGETALSISRDMIRKGIELKGSWHYNMKGVYDIMRIISDNRLKINQLITHKFPIDEIQHAWETQVSGECGKVLIEPWN